MSLRINNNIAAINGHRNMMNADTAISKSLEKLSSGLRINKAADDAAGLVISEQMRAQISGTNQAIANTETAVSMVQTAEGALTEMNSLLTKARELALHAANEGANDTNQLMADQSELDNIISSITRIAENTQFGTKKILDGSLSTSLINDNASVASFKINGPVAEANYDVSVTTAGVRANFTAASIDTSADAVALFNVSAGASPAEVTGANTFDLETTLSIENLTGAEVTVAAGSTLDEGLAALNQKIASLNGGASVTVDGAGQFDIKVQDIGTYANNYDFKISNANVTATVVDTAGTAGVNAAGQIAQVNDQAGSGAQDLALTLVQANRGTSFTFSDTTNFTDAISGSITLTEAAALSNSTYTAAVGVGDGTTFQIGANKNQTVNVSIDSMTASNLGNGSASSSTFSSLEVLATNNALINGQAQEALDVIDKAIDDVTVQRGELGAVQSNALETNLSSLRVSLENLTAAESTIRDVDFAAESANFTRNNIMIQASTAMLAQANQLPQNVLQLLG